MHGGSPYSMGTRGIALYFIVTILAVLVSNRKLLFVKYEDMSHCVVLSSRESQERSQCHVQSQSGPFPPRMAQPIDEKSTSLDHQWDQCFGGSFPMIVLYGFMYICFITFLLKNQLSKFYWKTHYFAISSFTIKIVNYKFYSILLRKGQTCCDKW